jgi:hypothetical protein
MYFRLPHESYLVPGNVLGRSEDLCYLSITGDIPDDENIAIFGRPFFQNYYTVLDQETMQIGFAANIGTEAAISEDLISDTSASSIIMGILGTFISLGLLYFFVKFVQKKLKQRKLNEKVALNKQIQK